MTESKLSPEREMITDEEHGVLKIYEVLLIGGRAVRDGLYEEYVNDMLKYRCQFKDGFKNGEGAEFYPNGQVKRQGTYKRGKKVGEGRSYHENGQLAAVDEFDDNGRKNGVCSEYNDLGYQTRLLVFKDGVMKEEINVRRRAIVEIRKKHADTERVALLKGLTALYQTIKQQATNAHANGEIDLNLGLPESNTMTEEQKLARYVTRQYRAMAAQKIADYYKNTVSGQRYMARRQVQENERA